MSILDKDTSVQIPSSWDTMRRRAIEALRDGNPAKAESILADTGSPADGAPPDRPDQEAKPIPQPHEPPAMDDVFRRARVRFQRFFEEFPQAALVVDEPTGRVTAQNRMARALLAIRAASPGDTIPLHRLGATAHDSDLIATALAFTRERGQATIGHVRLSRGGVSPIHARVHLDVITDEITGNPMVLAVVIDETPLKLRISMIERGQRQMRCIAEILQLGAQASLSINEILSEIPNLIANATSAPVRVLYEDSQYTSTDWHHNATLNRHTISHHGRNVGCIEFAADPDDDRAQVISGDQGTPLDTNSDVFAHTICAQVQRILENRLLSQKVIQAERMAAVGQIAAGVAHEFNNILTVIIGHAEDIVDDPAQPPHHQETAQRVLKVSDRATQLTGQLLAYARLQVLDPRRVDLRQAIAETLPVIKSSLEPGIALNVDTGASPASWVRVDPQRLAAALHALTRNAQDAIEESGTITITLHPADAPPAAAGSAPGDPMIAISITDDGCGMIAQTRELATEPFFTTKDRVEGRGLGLSVVSGFMAQSGGHLQISSIPGAGTTITLLFHAAGKDERGDHDEQT